MDSLADQVALPLWPETPGHPALAAMARREAWLPPAVVHVIPSLALGGAERIVADVAKAASALGAVVHVAVMRDAPSAHALDESENLHVHRLGHLEWPERLRRLAVLCATVEGPAFCHLTSLPELRSLWAAGVDTVPVVHNAEEGWTQSPEEWDRARVPLVVACGEKVARDLERRVGDIPVVALRHVVPTPPPIDGGHRDEVRRALGAGTGTLLVGMVGRVVPQKAHDRAATVLGELVSKGVDARIAVVGAIENGVGQKAASAASRAATEAGVRDRFSFLGGLKDASSLVGAFDVHLNVSRYEGVSIATMEAVAAGVPVVTLAAGGQDEAIGAADVLLPQSATAAEIADAVISAKERPPASRGRRESFVGWGALSWNWLSAMHGKAFREREPEVDVLLVTGNMDVGGAQRSLCTLAAGLARKGRRVAVAVCGPVGVPDFMTDAIDAGVRFLDLSGAGGRLHGVPGRLGRVLSTVMAERPKALCFWNMDAVTKAGVARTLRHSPTRVFDASPGPALFRELDEAADELRMMTASRKSYLRGLDGFVSKYGAGLPAIDERPSRVKVVPNGIEISRPLLDDASPRPPEGALRERSVLVVGRLNATKKIGLLPRIASRLGEIVPGATVTVVGGVHKDAPAPAGLPSSVRFLPPDTRAAAFAHRFACLLMLSSEQGCPNASLEAMAAGIPVVANDDGGTAEQVIDGATGRLLTATDDDGLVEQAANALADLLRDPKGAAIIGARAKAHVRTHFTVAAMVDGYDDLFLKE